MPKANPAARPRTNRRGSGERGRGPSRSTPRPSSGSEAGDDLRQIGAHEVGRDPSGPPRSRRCGRMRTVRRARHQAVGRRPITDEDVDHTDPPPHWLGHGRIRLARDGRRRPAGIGKLAARIAPPPGRTPLGVGYVASSFVPMRRAPPSTAVGRDREPVEIEVAVLAHDHDVGGPHGRYARPRPAPRLPRRPRTPGPSRRPSRGARPLRPGDDISASAAIPTKQLGHISRHRL